MNWMIYLNSLRLNIGEIGIIMVTQIIGVGIEDEDDYETCMKKWRDYKSKFPRVTSKEQFRLIDNYRN